MEPSKLTVPPTEIEIAELIDAVRPVPKLSQIARRLGVERGVLREKLATVERERDALEAAEANNCIAHAAEIESITERASTAEGLVRRLGLMLASIEWRGGQTSYGTEKVWLCPKCGRGQNFGHNPICPLAAALTAIPPALREGE